MFSPDSASIALELSMLWRVVLAIALGGALGLERSLAGKHAGMRTYALVSGGSAMFVIISVLVSQELVSTFASVNPVQIASNVVVGIGFLATGLTLLKGDHPVELTTAAGLWVSAGIGMAAGFGFPILATGGAILSIVILSILLGVENGMRAKYATREIEEVKAKPSKRRQTKAAAVE